MAAAIETFLEKVENIQTSLTADLTSDDAFQQFEYELQEAIKCAVGAEAAGGTHSSTASSSKDPAPNAGKGTSSAPAADKSQKSGSSAVADFDQATHDVNHDGPTSVRGVGWRNREGSLPNVSETVSKRG